MHPNAAVRRATAAVATLVVVVVLGASPALAGPQRGALDHLAERAAAYGRVLDPDVARAALDVEHHQQGLDALDAEIGALSASVTTLGDQLRLARRALALEELATTARHAAVAMAAAAETLVGTGNLPGPLTEAAAVARETLADPATTEARAHHQDGVAAHEGAMAATSAELAAVAERRAVAAPAARDAAIRYARARTVRKRLDDLVAAQARFRQDPPAPANERADALGALVRDADELGRAVGALHAQAAAPPDGRFLRPVAAAAASGFGPRIHPVTEEEHLHTGVDLGTEEGTPIVAARAGTVTWAGPAGGYGNLVVIAHDRGLSTAYAHQERLFVRTGQAVGAGEVVGTVGCTGTCTGPHLHFEVRRGGAPVDPAPLLG